MSFRVRSVFFGPVLSIAVLTVGAAVAGDATLSADHARPASGVIGQRGPQVRCTPLTAARVAEGATLAAGTCYDVAGAVVVRSGGLVLHPGVRVAFAANASLAIEPGAWLTAVGTAVAPIVFTSAERLPGSWQGIAIRSRAAGNRFDYVVFENGGSRPWTGAPDSRAMVYLDGNSKAVFTNSTFRGSGHYGLWVPAGGDIAGFRHNGFTGNARAMIVHPNRAGAIASDNRFSGNREDRVRVSFGNTDAVTEEQTWHDIGAPFHVTVRTFIRAPLTMAPGTAVEFAQDASLVVEAEGSLRAAGVKDHPVVFRGAEDLAGYWQGIAFATTSAGNVLEYAVLRNAGSRAWFGGQNAVASIHVDTRGLATLSYVRVEQSGGFAVVVRGRLTCSYVDDGGFRYYDTVRRTASPACPTGR